MLTAEEYARYQSFKSISEFGGILDPEAFKQARKAKFAPWLPAVLAPFARICDDGSSAVPKSVYSDRAKEHAMRWILSITAGFCLAAASSTARSRRTRSTC